MSTSITVKRYLDKQDIHYATVSCSGSREDIFRFGANTIPASQIAKAIILKDLRGMLMAVLPGPNDLSIDILNRQLHRNLRLAVPEDYRSIFNDCAPQVLPPLGEAYGFETMIDDSLLDQDCIYFVSGNDNEFIRISGCDFQLLHSNAWYGNACSRIVAENTTNQKSQRIEELTPSVSKIKQQIEKTTNLPPMPTMAQKIIQLNTNPYAHVEDLAKLIEKDPSLSAQIIRYAQSPFYGYRGSISSIRQAISRVLGYDLVMNIALGVAATKPFKITPHGALGLHAYWRHATYSAALAQTLCNSMPRRTRPRSGTTYACGLLHNFGFLVLGYLFPKEFAMINSAVSNDPTTPVLEHEMTLLGTDHCKIGQWLMEAWNMPQEIITTISEHHNINYSGPLSEYSRLVYVADCLLKSLDIGDAESSDVPATLLESLGLNESQAKTAFEKTIQGREDLDTMARQLAA